MVARSGLPWTVPGMTTSQLFDLDSYLASYSSLLLSPADWDLLRDDVFGVVRAAKPKTEADARGLLAAAGRFFASLALSGCPSLELLTRQNIRSYIEGCRRNGDNVGTLEQVDRRLRILETARAGRPAPAATRAAARYAVFDPYSDAELMQLVRTADVMAADGDSHLSDLIRLVEQDGARASDLPAAGLASAQVGALRAQLRATLEIRLEVHRLRHRWLARTVSRKVPVATLMTAHGVHRGDIETILPVVHPTDVGTRIIRSA